MKTIGIIISVILGLNLTMQIQAADQVNERIYLQTDKQTYLAGEMIWLKLITTTSDFVPLSFSQIGYVELIGSNSSAAQEIIELRSGKGDGWLEIPADLPTGYYRLIAYTKYMQNEKPTVFSEKLIPVINTFQKTAKGGEGVKDGYSVSSTVNTIVISSDNLNYSVRSNGEITIQNIPEDVHTLSLSVTGEDLPLAPSTDIIHWSRSDELKTKNKITYPYTSIPELEGQVIHGRLVDVESGMAVNGGEDLSPFIAVPGSDIRLFGGMVTEEGSVHFVTNRINGYDQLATVVFDPNDINKYRVDLESPFITHEEKELPELQLRKEWQDSLLFRSIGLQSLIAFHADSVNMLETPQSLFRWEPDNVYMLENYTRFSTMEDVLREIILSIRTQRNRGKRVLSVYTEGATGQTTGGSLVLLDGIPVFNHEEIFAYNPYLVKQIDIYRDRFIFSGNFYNGIINFQTLNNDLSEYKMENSSQLVTYQTVQGKRHFYAPQYASQEDRKNHIPDFRHTLLWLPEILHIEGRQVKVPFSTSDYKGTFKIKVEGITKRGRPIYGEGSFVVE